MEKKKKKSKKKIIIAIIAILVLVFIIMKFVVPTEEMEVGLETETIEKRDIVTSISATGTLAAEETKNIVSTLTGYEITSVNVKEGDTVSVGDIICTFDVSSLQTSLKTAQESLNLSTAQSNIGTQSAQRSLNDAITERDKQVESLQKAVDSASSNLTQAQTELTNIQNQISTLNTTKNTLNSQITQETANITNYQTKLTEAQTSGNQTEIDTATKELETAKTHLENFKSSLVNIETSIASSNTALIQAQTKVAEAQAAYDTAVDTYNTTSNTLNSQVASLQEQVTSSEISTKLNSTSQTSQIQTYKDQIAEGVLKATVSGTVTSVNVKKGDIYTGTTIATIEGCNNFIIEAEIDEYDIADIKEGMEVYIKTDATRDEELKGTVTYTASSATVDSSSYSSTTQSGTSTYKVKIEIEDSNDRLRTGMNAKLSIVTDSREDVWSVPYDAVLEREDGTKYIEYIENENSEEIKELDVQTGLEGSYYVEIISDEIKEGMQVVLPNVDTGSSLETLMDMMGADAGL